MYENENTEYMTASDVQEETPTFVDIEDVGSVMDEIIEDIQDTPDSLSDLEGEDKTEAGYMQGIEEELLEDLRQIEEILPEPENIEIELENPEDQSFVAPDNEGGEMVNQEVVEEFGDVNEVSVVDKHDFSKDDTLEALLDEQFNNEEHREESGLTAPADVVEVSADNVEQVHTIGNDTADTFADRAINDPVKIEVSLSDIEGDEGSKALDPLHGGATESEDVEIEDDEDEEEEETEAEVEDKDSDTTEEEVEVEANEETPADLEEATEEAEEIAGKDLDGDNEVGEDPEHVEEVEANEEEVVAEDEPVNTEVVETAADVSAEMAIVVEFDKDQIGNNLQVEEMELPDTVEEPVQNQSAIDNVTGVIANPADVEEIQEVTGEVAAESEQEVIAPEELVNTDLQEVLKEVSEFHDDEAALVDGSVYDSPEPEYNDIELPSEEVIAEIAEEEIEDIISGDLEPVEECDCECESEVNAGPTFVEEAPTEENVEVVDTEVEVEAEDLAEADEEAIENPANESVAQLIARAIAERFGWK